MISRYGWRGLLVALALVGCETDARAPGLDNAPPAPATGERGRIVFLGTSLTAGLGLDPDQAFPALIQRKLDAEGLRFEAVNAGVSGEASAGARRRIDWLLQQPAAVLVIETGANDGLRGLEVDSLRSNIQAMIDEAGRQSPKPAVVLVGMRAPPNLGSSYSRRFERVYPELAKKNDLPLVPFLLEGVAGRPSLNQADMIHPTAEGQQRMAEAVWEVLEPLLKQVSQARSSP
jgi:acyl-CoA thioesterase-1